MGQIHLPIAPSPELLALADPWDHVQNDAYRMHDLVLFNDRYYLYHGAGPAVLLFAPWRLITGRDFPEAAAVAIFCFAGFLFYAASLMRLLTVCGAKPRASVLSISLLALAVCQSAPYLCNRVDVYEVAIAGGLFCISAGFFFLTKGLSSATPDVWVAASGLAFGLAMSCRPHLIFAGCIAFTALIIWTWMSRRTALVIRWKGAVAFLAVFVVCGAVLGSYNYLRFGDPFEFGLQYLLAGAKAQQRILLSVANVLPGLYYIFMCPPDFSGVFPWVRLALRMPFGATEYPFPPGYFLEPTAGALWIAPFLIAAGMLPTGAPRVLRLVSWTAVVGAIFILLFIAASGFTTQRYLADFVPFLVFAAVTNLAVRMTRSSGTARSAAVVISGLLVMYSAVVNLALGIIGPYGDMISRRPASYVRIASWFSPVDEYRPRLNPSIRILLDVKFATHESGYQEPLVTLGSQGARHSVLVEHRGSELRLMCRSENEVDSSQSAMIIHKPSRIEISNDWQSRKLSVAVDGHRMIERPVAAMVTAPVQVMIGSNGLPGYVAQRFTGEIRVIEKVVSR